MYVLLLVGAAHAGQTDCVTKDGSWRWLSTTADAGSACAAGDKWVHGSKVVAEQAAGATGRLSWKPDEATKVSLRTTQGGGNTVQTFKWDVEVSATDGKPIAAAVSDTRVKLTMHCQRTSAGGAAPAPAAAAAKPAAPAAA